MPTPIPPNKATVTLEELNEKVDQILKYQKHTRRMAIARFVFSFLFFFIFIVLPILGSVYLFQYINETIDLDQAINQFNTFQSDISNLSDQSKKLDGLTDFGNLKQLLK